MSNLFRFFKSKITHDEDQIEMRQYFNFEEGNRVGFPADTVSFDYNHKLGCAMIGTKNGDVVVYGSHGTTWSYNINAGTNKQSEGNFCISKVLFMAEFDIFVLCKSGHVIKLEITKDALVRKEHLALNLDPNFKWKVTHVQKNNTDYNLIFACGSEVIRLSQSTMDVEVFISDHDWKLWSQSDTEFEVFDINTDPDNLNSLLIIVNGGRLGVYRDRKLRGKFTMINSDSSPVRQIVWDPTESFVYAIGVNNKYTKWKLHVGSLNEIDAHEFEPPSFDQADPYPCNNLKHFTVLEETRNAHKKKDFVIYEGGKNRANYDDRNIISVRQGSRCVAFEVLGEVIALRGIKGGYDGEERDGVVLIVTTTELLAIDLDSEDWKTMKPQFFFSVNNSTPTCQARTISVEDGVWNKLLEVSDLHWSHLNFSHRDWPLTFYEEYVIDSNKERPASRQVHLTGHSSGLIYVWASGSLHMKLLMIVRTSAEFLGYTPPTKSGKLAHEDGVEPTIPVARIGDYDPFEDDENLAISQIYFDKLRGTLIAANRGGFILFYDLYEKESHIGMANPKKIVWDQPTKRSFNTLIPRNRSFVYPPGFQPSRKEGDEASIAFQMTPNVDLTSICYMQHHSCLAIGGDNGFLFIDVRNSKLVENVPFHIEEGADRVDDKRLSKYKTLKKSLRRTFRRKKRPEATLNISLDTTQTSSNRACSNTIRSNGSEAVSLPRSNWNGKNDDDDGAVQHVERQIEARADLPDSSPTWIVTCMKTFRLPITNKSSIDDVIAIGTSGGKVLFYKISEKTDGAALSFDVSKVETIRLAQPMPIVNVDLSCEEGYFSSASTRLVVFSDEQIRFYSFPGKVKTHRYKLTSLEGLRIKRGCVVKLSSKHVPTNTESFACIVTNEGDLRLHSLEHPECFQSYALLNKFDIMGLTSVVLTRDGEITYLKRSSEIQRVTVNQPYRGWSNRHQVSQ